MNYPSAIPAGAEDVKASVRSAVHASRRPFDPVSSSAWLTYGRRAGLLCAFITALAILVTHPALEMGTSDDWSYARTALDLVRTGHIVYNGWATAMLGWQIVWGALVIKLFGFSFLALRLSTLPFAMGAAYLLYQICARLGLNVQNAALATLTVVLSPLYLPLAASFMTDVPAFFWLLVGLYGCLRAMQSSTSRACILWLAFAAVTDVTAGSARQIVWLGALVMVPCAAWLERKRAGVLLGAALLWAGSIAAVYGCLYWFNLQPYSIPEKVIAGEFTFALVPHLLQQVRDMILSILLLSLPVLAAFLVTVRSAPKRIFFPLLGVAMVLLAARAHLHGIQALAPWTPNIVTEYGVGGAGSWENLGQKPAVLLPWLRTLLTVTVLLATCAWLAKLIPRIRSRRAFSTASPAHLSWGTVWVLLGPFTLAYFALLMPRATFNLALDRYLIPLVAVFVIVVLRYFQNGVERHTPGFCFVLLALFSAYGVAATHDYFATGRARLEAATNIHDTGISRTEIQGGWEYDGWTQLSATGYINDPRLNVPAGAYKRVNRVETLPAACRFDFARLTPAIDPRYFVVFSPQSCLAPSSFPPVAYKTWLPPFHRQIYIQQLSAAN